MSRGSSRVWIACVVACLLPALAAAVQPAAARAAASAERTYIIGTGGVPYSLATPSSDAVAVVSTATGQQLTIRTVERTSFGASSDAYRNYGIAHPDPRGVEAMTDGNVLVADAANHRVLWMRSDGLPVWSYGTTDDAALRAPVCVRRVTNSSFLVVDQDFGEIGEQLLYCHEKIPPDRCNAVRERRGESAAYQKNNAAAKDNIAARLRVRR